MNEDRKSHWENVYESKKDHQVGWFQERPETSLKLINKYVTSKNNSIIDVGGGNSFLAKILFEESYSDLTVLDISEKAIVRNQSRFGNNLDKIKWVVSDVLDYSAKVPFRLWHDRAVFHFLTDRHEITKYAEEAANNIVPHGYLIVGTFSISGPKQCSNLPITQYSKEKFQEIFYKYFEMVEHFEDIHITPSGNQQNFIWCVLKRK